VALGADGTEGRERLSRDLFAVGDEENAIRLELDGVEGREPRLSESGRETQDTRQKVGISTSVFGNVPAKVIHEVAINFVGQRHAV
jgi:hypothetical protein